MSANMKQTPAQQCEFRIRAVIAALAPSGASMSAITEATSGDQVRLTRDLVLARLQREGLFVLGKRHGRTRVFLSAADCEAAGCYVLAPPPLGTAADGPVLHDTAARISGLAGAQGAARYEPRGPLTGRTYTDKLGRKITVLPSASCDERYQVAEPAQFVGEFTRAHRERIAGLGG
jgi:hypothetical protein